MNTPSGSLPKISIVTATLNQANFIEQTIVSVLSQGYPNLEYFIIDAGSTDGSVDIIKKYSDKLAYWVSEPDKGHANAVNKAMARATGDILAFINSDDYYLPGAFDCIAHEYMRGGYDVICGRCNIVNEKGKILSSVFGGCNALEDFLDFMYYCKRPITQPEAFWSRRIYDKCGPLREDIYFPFDYEYWLRFAANKASFRYIDKPLSCFRIQKKQKTFNNDVRINREHIMIIKEYLNKYPDKISLAKKQAIQKNISLLSWHTDYTELLEKREFGAAFRMWLKLMKEGMPKSLVSFFRWKKFLRLIRAYFK